ncbi:hypothetical protein [uncultured Nostoc sp.]
MLHRSLNYIARAIAFFNEPQKRRSDRTVKILQAIAFLTNCQDTKEE